MRTLTVSLLGVAAVALSLAVLRQQRQIQPPPREDGQLRAGESVPGTISLERLRELGL